MRLRLWVLPSIGLMIAFAGMGLSGSPLEEDCCPCQDLGEEHDFSTLCNWCSVDDPPPDCRRCEGEGQPEGHPGCHANQQGPGECYGHPDCPGDGGGAVDPLTLSHLAAANNKTATLQTIRQATSLGRLQLQVDRAAIQVLDCDRKRVIAHYTVSDELLAALSALQ
jgi:hypothetical protein